MEDNIFDFSKFKRQKEEGVVQKPETKKSEANGLSDFQDLMTGMIKQVSDVGATDESISDALLSFQLEFSPNGEAIRNVRSFVKLGSTAYREAYERANNLSLEEIRGQIESANEMLIKAHPTWYVVLVDYLNNRTKPK